MFRDVSLTDATPNDQDPLFYNTMVHGEHEIFYKTLGCFAKRHHGKRSRSIILQYNGLK